MIENDQAIIHIYSLFFKYTVAVVACALHNFRVKNSRRIMRTYLIAFRISINNLLH